MRRLLRAFGMRSTSRQMPLNEAIMHKLTTLREAITGIPDGAVIALGGNTLSRAPMAAVFELARQKKRWLGIVKTAGAMDIDLLCLAGCVSSVDAGFVSYESEYSLARHFRTSVQKELVRFNEHACYTVISALRAAACGIPFMPVHGLERSGLIDVNPCLKRIADPYSGDIVTVVSAIRPDYALLHVHMADVHGNAKILGAKYEDVLLSRASKHVILTTEEIVDTEAFRSSEHRADIPGFMVAAVVHVPKGAAPCACFGLYEPDHTEIKNFLSIKDESGLEEYLKKFEVPRHV